MALYSIAGHRNQGKSFFLELCAYELAAAAAAAAGADAGTASTKARRHGNTRAWTAWLKEQAKRFFEWRGQRHAGHTQGIHMLAEPFIVRRRSDGERVAVFLMDTQGQFDSASPAAKILQVSLLSASCQVLS